MRTPCFALLLAFCTATALSAQTLQTRVLPNYTSPIDDPATQQNPNNNLAIKGQLIARQWLLAPNPTPDGNFRLNLELLYPTELEARVVSLDGRIAAADRFSQLPEGINTLEFELGDFPAGLYYLNLRNAEGMVTIPFVIGQ